MKKVLILTVIAILALGVMALANTTDSVGATCSTTTLQVTSNIYVLAGFEATATGYDATFCGASGKLISGTLLKESSSQWNPAQWPGNVNIYYKHYLILARLDLKSNYQDITVAVTHEGFFDDNNLGSHIDVKAGDVGAYLSNNQQKWHLPVTTGSPYSGTLYVYYDAYNNIPQWTEANKYSETIEFTVTPINPTW